jgi:chromosome segregation ATPase
MAKPLRLASVAPERSAERAELATGIARLAEAHRRVAAVETAIETIEPTIWSAQDGIERAQAAIETAKTAAARHLADLAMGTAGPAPVTITAARSALVSAEDELSARQAARKALDSELEAAKAEVGNAGRALDRAALTVAAAEAGARASRLLAEHVALQRRYLESRAVMEFLDGLGVLAFAGSAWRYEPKDIDGAAAWRAALAALRTDADAPLPTM